MNRINQELLVLSPEEITGQNTSQETLTKSAPDIIQDDAGIIDVLPPWPHFSDTPRVTLDSTGTLVLA